MPLTLQIPLENEAILLLPLQEQDFETLYLAASDPLIWEQHPNKDRWKREIFETYFKGALESKGAHKIIDKSTGQVIGCTRFYDYEQEANCILIGYTFFARVYWGKGVNTGVKTLMLNHIFQFVDSVYFHIGSQNLRSQMAISKLGAKKIKEQEITYFGESPKLNCIFRITKEEWQARLRTPNSN